MLLTCSPNNLADQSSSNYPVKNLFMLHPKLTAVLVATLVSLSGCLSFLGPISNDHKILGHPLADTLLVVEENFVDGSTIVPAGIYRPDSVFSRGVANYVGSQPLSVKLMGFIERKCFGGVSTEFEAPMSKYKLFLYDCGGEKVITYAIPKTLKFRIVRGADLQSLP